MAIDKIQSESINLADNFAFTGTVTGAGGTNTPCFQAYASGTLAVNDSVYTTLAFNNQAIEVYQGVQGHVWRTGSDPRELGDWPHEQVGC